MNTTQHSSLKADIGRVLPVDHPRGNWADTIHKGALIDGNGAAIDLTEAVTYYILGFFQDAPIIWELGAIITVDQGISHQMGALVIVNHTVAGLAAQIAITPNEVSADQYTQISGVTPTAGVPVRGYAGTTTLPDYAIVGNTGSGSIQLIAQGSVMYGLQTAGNGERVVGTATPEANCYLLETAYTQVMRDAGNTFAPGGVLTKICGLVGLAT